MEIDSNTLALVSACTALVASVAGPSVQLLIARRQINANLISANRQKWIEALRDLISELWRCSRWERTSSSRRTENRRT